MLKLNRNTMILVVEASCQEIMTNENLIWLFVILTMAMYYSYGQGPSRSTDG